VNFNRDFSLCGVGYGVRITLKGGRGEISLSWRAYLSHTARTKQKRVLKFSVISKRDIIFTSREVYAVILNNQETTLCDFHTSTFYTTSRSLIAEWFSLGFNICQNLLDFGL
jgi:hypothetical protein